MSKKKLPGEERFAQGEYLKMGYVVELEFEGSGRQRNIVVAEAEIAF